MILNEDTTPEEVSEFILEASEYEIDSLFESKYSQTLIKLISPEARAKMNAVTISQLKNLLDDIMDIAEKSIDEL